jgi:magnesium chelatase subunit D
LRTYPFCAIVGHDQLRLALILCAVRPEIGGVLIRGEKGTAKSTAVRGLAALLSAASDPAGADARLVELPIGATEDRVIGSLDLQRSARVVSAHSSGRDPRGGGPLRGSRRRREA